MTIVHNKTSHKLLKDNFREGLRDDNDKTDLGDRVVGGGEKIETTNDDNDDAKQ